MEAAVHDGLLGRSAQATTKLGANLIIEVYATDLSQSLLSMQGAFRNFQSSEEAQLDSQALQELTTPGQLLPEFASKLEYLLGATDWEAATQEGRIIPDQVSSVLLFPAASPSLYCCEVAINSPTREPRLDEVQIYARATYRSPMIELYCPST